jgi:predicted phosphatase
MTDGMERKNSFSLLIEGIWNAIKTARTIILAGVLVLSLAFNVAVVAIEAVTEIAEEVFERIVGKPTPRAARLALAQQQVRGLGRTVAAQGRTISANAAGLRRALLDIQLRDRQMATLSRDLVRMRMAAYVDMDGRRVTVRETIKSLSARVARRTAFGATRSASMAFSQAIPWIGTAVIATITAAELKDACDTMYDLHALDIALDPMSADESEKTRVCGLPVPTFEELWAATKSTTSSVVEYVGSRVPEMPEVGIPFWD